MVTMPNTERLRGKRDLMFKSAFAGTLISLGLFGVATAQSCTTLPYNLTTSATADAVQLMANFNYMGGCAAPSASPTFSGNVLIGSTQSAHTFPLRIVTSNSWGGIELDNYYTVPNQYAGFVIGQARGTPAAPTATQAGDEVGFVRFNGWGSSGARSGAEIASYAGSTNYTDSSSPGVLVFRTTPVNSSSMVERMRIDSSGYVGIGTPAAAPLEVNGDIQTSAGLRFAASPGSSTSRAYLVVQGDNNLVFYGNNASLSGLYPIYSAPVVSNSPSFNFYVPVYYPSDARLKKNIASLTGALAIIQQLRPVQFDWRLPSERAVGQALQLSPQRQNGFVAQEVLPVVPDAVHAPAGGGDNIYTMDPTKLIPILVEAVKEQQAEIAALTAQIKALGGGIP